MNKKKVFIVLYLMIVFFSFSSYIQSFNKYIIVYIEKDGVPQVNKDFIFTYYDRYNDMAVSKLYKTRSSGKSLQIKVPAEQTYVVIHVDNKDYKFELNNDKLIVLTLSQKTYQKIRRNAVVFTL